MVEGPMQIHIAMIFVKAGNLEVFLGLRTLLLDISLRNYGILLSLAVVTHSFTSALSV